MLIGNQAPAIETQAVINQSIQPFSLSQLLGRYVLLFFYPLDFTFVCPTELLAFQEQLSAFDQRGATVLGCSVDSAHTHLAWLRTPRQVGGIEGINYPLLSDLTKQIARDYQVLHEPSGVAYRGLFLLDRSHIIRHQLINDLPLGRSVPEALRLLDALIYHEQHGEVCPANWSTGQKAMHPTLDGLARYFKEPVSI